MKDGGPAFPDPGRAQSEKQRAKLGNPGMSLRDYFASAALQAFLSDEWMNETVKLFATPVDANDIREFVTAKAYRWADAMIAEREKS